MTLTSLALHPPLTPAKTWLKLALAIASGCLLLWGAYLWNLSLSSSDFGSLADGKITVLRSALHGQGADPETAAAASRPVSLPHRVDNRATGHVHYRVPLPADLSQDSSHTPRALCVPRWSSNASVWVDGQKLLDHNDATGRLAIKELQRAAYLALPNNLLKDAQHLDIRLRAVPGTFPGLSEIWLGEQNTIRRKCSALQDSHMGSRIGGLYLMVFLTLMATVIALHRADELALAFALVGFFWCLQSMVLLDWLPHDSDVTWLAWMHLARPLPAIASIWLALRLTGSTPRVLKRAILIVVGLSYAIFPFLGTGQWNLWLLTVGACLAPLVLLAWLKLVWHAARSVYLSDFTFTVAMFFGIGMNLMELGRNQGWLAYSALSMTYLVVPVVSLAIGFLVLERLQEFLRRQADSARLLEQKLQAQKVQLAATHKALQEQREKALLNDERQRMVRDMHDGLGTQLVSASALLKSGARRDAQSDELAELIDHALLDLRSLLDVFSSTAQNHHDDDDTVSLLLSMLRHRLSPVFRAQGIRLDWNAQPLPPQFLPEDRQRLQLLRLLQEACTNIIKHAQAKAVTLSTRTSTDTVVIEVQDDGRGMDAARAASSQRPGHGMNNMSVRAEKLGAKLIIDSTVSGTCVRLIFPRPS